MLLDAPPARIVRSWANDTPMSMFLSARSLSPSGSLWIPLVLSSFHGLLLCLWGTEPISIEKRRRKYACIHACRQLLCHCPVPDGAPSRKWTREAQHRRGCSHLRPLQLIRSHTLHTLVRARRASRLHHWHCVCTERCNRFYFILFHFKSRNEAVLFILCLPVLIECYSLLFSLL